MMYDVTFVPRIRRSVQHFLLIQWLLGYEKWKLDLECSGIKHFKTVVFSRLYNIYCIIYISDLMFE